MAKYLIGLLDAVPSFDQAYTYHTTTLLRIGDRVLVPFGAKQEPREGVVLGHDSSDIEAKPVISRLSARPLAHDLVESLQWAEDYYVAPIGGLARLALPRAVRYQLELSYDVLDQELPEQTITDLTAGRLSGRQIDQLVENGQLARIYSAQPKALPGRRYFLLDDRAALEALQAELSLRQKIIHQVIDRLLRDGQMAVSKSIKTQHIERLSQAGVRLIIKPAQPEPNQPAESLPELNRAQRDIAGAITSGSHILYGPPASGKTTLLYELIRRCLAQGYQAVYLVGERLLAEQVSHRLKQLFAQPVATLHGQLSEGEIRQYHHFIASGDYPIVVGTRNSVLAPFHNLGLIVIDDFHDDAFYSDEPAVDFRRLALDYADRLDIPIVLASSTPDLSFLADEAITKHYLAEPIHPVERRYELVDMKTQLVGPASAWLSRPLEQALDRKSLLFLNRIGYASLVICRQCSQALSCPGCAQPLMYQKTERRLQCRACGTSQAVPAACPACGSDQFDYVGLGLERLADVLAVKYPDKKIRQFDSRSLRKKTDLAKAGDWLEQADILLATQILTKGHIIPDLSVVGLLSPDTMLYTPEYRAREKCFQTIIQVAGRVGRDQPGEVYIQTYTPDHDVYGLAAQQDIPGFYRREYQLRKMHGLPPLTHMIKLVVADRTRASAQDYADKLCRLLSDRFDYTFKGPYSPLFEKVSGLYRQQILVSHTSQMSDLKDFLRSVKPRRSVRLSVLVDPLTTLY